MLARRALTAVAISLSWTAAGPLTQQPTQQRPSFKTGVELVTVDFSVVDSKGQAYPIYAQMKSYSRSTDNRARSSSLTFLGDAGGGRVTSSDTATATTADSPPTAVSSNTESSDGRLIVLAVDVGHIHSGGAFILKRAVGALLERLRPADLDCPCHDPPGPWSRVHVGARADQRKRGQARRKLRSEGRHIQHRRHRSLRD